MPIPSSPGSSRLIVIGAGNMATALLRGVVAARLPEPARWVICDPERARREEFERDPYVDRVERLFADPGEAASTLQNGDQLMLAVKPQMLSAVARSVAPALKGKHPVVISILAGAGTSLIRRELGGDVTVIRAMPNLPAGVGVGMAALSLGDGATDEDAALARAILGSCGRVIQIDETLMDAFTALAGSGPAYLLYLAEAMARAGVEMGFDRDVADLITRQTLLGASTMLDGSEDSAGTLRSRVTSKGGTTAAATEEMDQAGMMDTLVRAMLAARDRGEELGRS